MLAVASGEMRKRMASASGRRGVASRRVCDARRRTARGQRGQPAVDARRTHVRRFLNPVGHVH